MIVLSFQPPETKLRQSMAHLFHLVRCNRYEELNAALAEDHNRHFVNVRPILHPLASLFAALTTRTRLMPIQQARDNIGYTLTHLGKRPIHRVSYLLGNVSDHSQQRPCTGTPSASRS